MNDMVGLLQPCLQGCFPAQASMGRSVVFGFQPGLEAGVQIRQAAHRLLVQRTQEPVSDRAKDPLNFSPRRSHPHPGVDQGNSENGEDACGLGGNKCRAIVGEDLPNTSVGHEHMAQTVFKGQGSFPVGESAVHYPSGRVIQNHQQDRALALPLFIRDLKGVHQIRLHALQRILEVKLQLLPLFLALHTGLPLQPGGQHQPGQGGLGDLRLNDSLIAQFLVHGLGGEFRIVL